MDYANREVVETYEWRDAQQNVRISSREAYFLYSTADLSAYVTFYEGTIQRNLWSPGSWKYFAWFDYSFGSSLSFTSMVGGQSYSVLVRRTPDITEGAVLGLPVRTEAALKKLLVDDLWVKSHQTVRAEDGTEYTVWISSMSQLSFRSGADQLNAQWDSQDRLVLTIPQSDGVAKVYEVKIDAKGIVKLVAA
jgi:hypothetical protein